MNHLKGLTSVEVEASRQAHGSNILTPPERDPIWKQFLEKFDDPIIRILITAAMIAIVVGIFEGNALEGFGIIVAILLATTVAFLNEYKANQEFNILNQMNDEVPIKVIRDDSFTTVPKKDIVIGDIVLVELGEEIPADARILDAVSLKVNEANLTGESASVNKVTVATFDDWHEDLAYPPDQVFRGTYVTDGHGVLEVIAVGDHTEIGKTARSVATQNEVETPLNLQLDRLSRLIGVLGLAIAILIDIALIVRGIITNELNLTFSQWYIITSLFVSLTIVLVPVWMPIVSDGLELAGIGQKSSEDSEENNWIENLKTLGLGCLLFATTTGIGYGLNWISGSPTQWIPTSVAAEFITYFMIAVAVIVVAVPEGLALSVTLSLGYSMEKMAKQNNLVRRMHACETIGATTVICSDKTGTLTLNQMRVSDYDFPCLWNSSAKENPLLVEAITANSTANLERHPGETSHPLGNPTEGALLMWLADFSVDYVTSREQFVVTHQLAFTSERKYMTTLGISPSTGRSVLHIKGAPDILLSHCNQILTPEGVISIQLQERNELLEELRLYESMGKRTLAFAYIPEPTIQQQDVKLEEHEDMIWLGFVAIADPVRPEVPEAVRECLKAGINVKMITGDSLLTAQQIAQQIGIATQNDSPDVYITGSQLRLMDDETAQSVLKYAKVIARVRPQDKQRIVQLLQAAGEVVAVTGDGTNDASALSQAQVGLAMGSGTFVCKEASDIILLDNSFASVERAVLWGRSLYQNIQKFILFQLTINVAACGIALLGPFIGIDLPLTVTQLLWVNLIMDTFAALALATEPPSLKVMEMPPRDSQAFIISKPMATSIFSVGLIFLVFLIGFLVYIQRDQIITPYELSLFFTTFVMLQFWNLFNARCFGLKQSAFSNLFSNWSFVGIAVVILIGQILMVQFGGQVFRTVPLCLTDWLIIIGGTSIVLWIGEIRRFFARRLTVSQSEFIGGMNLNHD
ncbi:calcium-translocating P-type ATPase, PMCA-type [Lyngbya sp. PCC 8106]|uniref:calcium-translocating P-type ATPase, PMCA-type n=1 Tax=Lyngbya sp. (strain PCC 8106) TaxID=313612 RepID=UPI0000EAC630|nr:calcium-translocating P-type ATPase, PMCA-type [Lyngbya sp. PCC 8106]EAW38481.1 putative calcium-transporting ATPase [Lyngbya sp. PCC 8106]